MFLLFEYCNITGTPSQKLCRFGLVRTSGESLKSEKMDQLYKAKSAGEGKKVKLAEFVMYVLERK